MNISVCERVCIRVCLLVFVDFLRLPVCACVLVHRQSEVN